MTDNFWYIPTSHHHDNGYDDDDDDDDDNDNDDDNGYDDDDDDIKNFSDQGDTMAGWGGTLYQWWRT